ncbi:hypothetical protein [Arsenophonus sp. PmNCSU2021_1]|uniref:hypothetical protein n=1 Tax=Arsenophonus sp. PmNCSU2021_1 TaxID=3118989 RepID=UPI002FEF3B87
MSNEKVDVHSACQLRDFGKSKGFGRYIPVIFGYLPLPRCKTSLHLAASGGSLVLKRFFDFLKDKSIFSLTQSAHRRRR